MKRISIFTAILLASLLAILQISKPLADFNGDRVSELVVGIPGESPEYEGTYPEGAGAFDVMYGVLGIGFNDYMETMLWQGFHGVFGLPEAGDAMGNALAIGDFNGDDNWDLAVGVYKETLGEDAAAGGVQIFYGDGEVLRIDNSHMITQDTTGVPGVAEDSDYFGEVLAAGNFNGDAYDDLAVGVPHEDGGASDSGIVTILFGSAGGLTGTGSLMLRQGHDGLPDSEEFHDYFGSTLAVGDFDNDGHDDLAIGVSNETLETPEYPNHAEIGGLVHVVYGAHISDPGFNDDLLYEDSTTFDICENSNSGDLFGWSLATGEFNEGVFDDLAIGVLKTGDGDEIVHGGIHVVFGGVDGLRDIGDQCLNSNDMGLTFDGDDNFCRSMASCDYNGDGYTDLALGAPADSTGWIDSHGSLAVVYGGSSGIRPTTTELFQQGQDGLQEEKEDDDLFGWKLTGGNFNGDRYCDLAVGVDYEDVGNPTIVDAGVVQILFGSEVGITTQSNQLWYQGYNGMLQEPGEYDHFGFSLASIPFYNNEWVFLPLIRR
jgi:hypothetical protein